MVYKEKGWGEGGGGVSCVVVQYDLRRRGACGGPTWHSGSSVYGMHVYTSSSLVCRSTNTTRTLRSSCMLHRTGAPRMSWYMVQSRSTKLSFRQKKFSILDDEWDSWVMHENGPVVFWTFFFSSFFFFYSK